ncbi:MAG: SDR family NAD(P)-dependent oxidoreductase [Sphingobacteriales bacterium]|nr:MAG: SDR family NAD(P)-dependent oxidoreductase [Sphingobacteriales bacterium]
MKHLLLITLISLFGMKTQAAEQPYAMIAGGSKGIGYGLAEALAKRSFNLILVARHEGPLKDAKANLEQTYHIKVETIAKDLSEERTAVELAEWCTQRNIPLKMLCNVAGFGGSRDFMSNLPLDSLRYMIHVNIESGMALTYTLLPILEKNAPSYVLNISSMAGLAPMPQKNLYSATKSSVLFFSYSLRYELKDKGISVSCLAPGPVLTKKEVVDETRKQMGTLGMKMAMKPHEVGEIAIRKTLKGRMLIVPGTMARVSSMALRVLPRRWSAALYNELMKDDKGANE